ncbi:transposase [Nitrosomonas eutropha]|nr:transposase [Nitrosomonas eutropha]
METRKQYTKEFKLDAISLVLDQGYTPYGSIPKFGD